MLSRVGRSNRFSAKVMPYLMLSTGVVFAMLLLVIFSYLLFFALIFACILYVILHVRSMWRKKAMAHARTTRKKGRTYDHDTL